MKTLKKLSSMLLICLAICTTQTLFAQRGFHGFQGKHLSPEQMLEKMTKELNLTTTQQAQIQQILENGATKMRAIRTSEGEHEDKKTAIHKLKKEQKEQIGAVLTDEQKAKAKALKVARKKEHKERMKGLRAEMETYKNANMTPVLQAQRKKLEAQLSDADKSEIEAIRTNLQEIREDLKTLKAHKKEAKASKTDVDEATKNKFKTLMETKKVEMQKARAIVKKYDTQIEALQDEIKPQVEQWEKDMKAIAEKYKLEGSQKSEFKPRMEGQGFQRNNKKGKHPRRGGEMNKVGMKKVKFLLMDMNAPSNTND